MVLLDTIIHNCNPFESWVKEGQITRNNIWSHEMFEKGAKRAKISLNWGNITSHYPISCFLHFNVSFIHLYVETTETYVGFHITYNPMDLIVYWPFEYIGFIDAFLSCILLNSLKITSNIVDVFWMSTTSCN